MNLTVITTIAFDASEVNPILKKYITAHVAVFGYTPINETGNPASAELLAVVLYEQVAYMA
ncbi:hypothetical protein [Desulfovibrio sp. An276]|uniref:hypothetical protein n=1 Tax=Desulfovibrio sp. An276 TaxID=1965618 RepID=UPI0013A6639C|nr:hypothetical protein [Desulfovibrio sp. An276]